MDSSVTIHRGLRGVYFTTTAISDIDGERGRLTYRGYDIGELTERHTFEDVLHLLLLGELPGARGAKGPLTDVLAHSRALPGHVTQLLQTLPADVDMMSCLRTAVSALGGAAYSWPPTLEQAAALIAKVPTLIACRHRLSKGLPPVEPDPELSLAANYLYMLHGERPNPDKAQALEAYLILTAEHGMNASTFAARVTTSTHSDLISALTTAIGTLKGPLHGGAPSEVTSMLQEIGEKEKAEPYLRSLLERGERIMGFGHRVYRTKDPRAIALGSIAKRLLGNEKAFELALHVEEVALRLLQEYKPGRELHTNVEFYAAAVLGAVGLEPSLFTPTFAVSRFGGWVAHILEQAQENEIIRPLALYTGTQR